MNIDYFVNLREKTLTNAGIHPKCSLYEYKN